MRQSLFIAIGRLSDRIRSFPAAREGIAAVEFAMVLPIMVFMYLGMTDLTFGISNDRKLTALARTLADLVSRSQTISTGELQATFTAATVVLAPFDASRADMVVSSVLVTAVPNSTSVEGRIAWSCKRGPTATARVKDAVYPVPAGFQTAGSSFILAEVTMDYRPMFGSGVIGTLSLNESTPWPVRGNQSAQVVWQGGTTACPS